MAARSGDTGAGLRAAPALTCAPNSPRNSHSTYAHPTFANMVPAVQARLIAMRALRWSERLLRGCVPNSAAMQVAMAGHWPARIHGWSRQSRGPAAGAQSTAEFPLMSRRALPPRDNKANEMMRDTGKAKGG